MRFHVGIDPVSALPRFTWIMSGSRHRTFYGVIPFRPAADARYKHIDGLFTGAID